MNLGNVGRLAGSLAAALLVMAAHQAVVNATTITVNAAGTVAGDGLCSFDEAIAAVNQTSGSDACPFGNGSNDTISIPAGYYNATDGAVISRSVTISGASASNTALFFAGPGPALTFAAVFATIQNILLEGPGSQGPVNGIVNSGAALNLIGLTIADFHTGIDNSIGSATLTSCVVIGNSGSGIRNSYPTPMMSGVFIYKSRISYNTTSPGPTELGDGGGLANYGHAEIYQSSFENNVVSNAFSGGAIFADRELIIQNSTITGNAAGAGGGIYVNTEAPGYLIARSITVTNNTAVIGGGIDFFSATATLDVGNCSLIAGNHTTVGGGGPDVYGDMSRVTGVGMVGNSTGAIAFPSAWRVANPLFGPYSAINDETGSYPLLAGSPAIDSCPQISSNSDQRGFPVPMDGNGDGVATADFGSFEFDPWQTERLTVAARSSDDTHTIVTDSGYSLGKGTIFQANNGGDFVTYAVRVPTAGTYRIAVRENRGSNRGRYQLATAANFIGPYTNRGGVQDLYVNGSDFVEADLGTADFTSGGAKFFRFLVTGKSAGSTQFFLAFDYLKLTKL